MGNHWIQFIWNFNKFTHRKLLEKSELTQNLWDQENNFKDSKQS